MFLIGGIRHISSPMAPAYPCALANSAPGPAGTRRPRHDTRRQRAGSPCWEDSQCYGPAPPCEVSGVELSWCEREKHRESHACSLVSCWVWWQPPATRRLPQRRSPSGLELIERSFFYGREYFILRSGRAQMVVQADRADLGPAFTYFVFDARNSGQSEAKQQAFNFDPLRGVAASGLVVELGGFPFTAWACTETGWRLVDGVPWVERSGGRAASVSPSHFGRGRGRVPPLRAAGRRRPLGRRIGQAAAFSAARPGGSRRGARSGARQAGPSGLCPPPVCRPKPTPAGVSSNGPLGFVGQTKWSRQRHSSWFKSLRAPKRISWRALRLAGEVAPSATPPTGVGRHLVGQHPDASSAAFRQRPFRSARHDRR